MARPGIHTVQSLRPSSRRQSILAARIFPEAERGIQVDIAQVGDLGEERAGTDERVAEEIGKGAPIGEADDDVCERGAAVDLIEEIVRDDVVIGEHAIEPNPDPRVEVELLIVHRSSAPKRKPVRIREDATHNTPARKQPFPNGKGCNR